ncbi:MAG: hypothetical protein K9N46_12280 [Candidatus Marinimicrobia bacterium]|nr:hypothetical protein [Candidatus Neomarinimicrobiota bacterium]MCF7829093.1 hypothetical protein [Candidatus Neomarinimicrobiota bacterium]MCF7881508.1 hypothetical protein [Candidatus Neomarinimicrobiota bacterium]
MGQLVGVHRGMTQPGSPETINFAEVSHGVGMLQADTAGGVINLVENEVYIECQENDLDYDSGDFGEHLTVEWVALDTLQAGDLIFIEDEVQLEVIAPYHIPDWVEGLTDILAVVEEPIGVQTKVISGGNIAVDMMVHVELQGATEEY